MKGGGGCAGLCIGSLGFFFFVLGVTGCNARSMITMNDDKNINEWKLREKDTCNY